MQCGVNFVKKLCLPISIYSALYVFEGETEIQPEVVWSQGDRLHAASSHVAQSESACVIWGRLATLGGTGWWQGQAPGDTVSTRATGLGLPWGPCSLKLTGLSCCGPARPGRELGQAGGPNSKAE